MKKPKTMNGVIKLAIIPGLAAGLNLNTHAATVLTNQHTDIGVAYENGAWNLHIHNETDDIEYSPPSGPDGAILQVGSAAAGTVSSDSSFSFLGPAGSSIWILPNTQNPDLLFLGFGAEELEPGLFVGDSVNMRLSSVSGPGEFAVFDYDFLGSPTALMNTRDGVTAGDSVNLAIGAHNDLNWAFSAPGLYTVSFEASGTLADGNVFTSSGPVEYTFSIQPVPEPASLALFGLGGLGALLLVRRMKHQ